MRIGSVFSLAVYAFQFATRYTSISSVDVCIQAVYTFQIATTYTLQRLVAGAGRAVCTFSITTAAACIRY